MANFYADGVGGSTGDSLALASPLLVSGHVLYVHHTGSDSYMGLNRTQPFATLRHAIGEASAFDIIVCLDGHAETLTAVLDINISVTIVGEGSDAGVPTVRFTHNAASGSMMSFSAHYSSIRGVRFPASLQSADSARISIAGNGFLMKDCYVELGNFDSAGGVSVGEADFVRVTGTTFISEATAVATVPGEGLATTGSPAGLVLDGVVFSGGAYGFREYAMLAIGLSDISAEGVSLLLGADIGLSDVVQGYVNVAVSTGGGRVDWTLGAGG